MTDKIDPSTLSGTELLLREKYAKDTLVTSPSETPVEAIVKQALPANEEASEEHVNAFKAALELLAARDRAAKMIEVAKQAQKNKGTQ
jgi:thymidylate kinase